MRALVIDDSGTIRKIVRQTLEARLKLRVAEAEDVGEAMDRLSWGEPPDIVITDLLMPGLNGTSLIRRLRGHDSTARVPILVLSVDVGHGDVARQVREAGATAFLAKPFRLDDLAAKVRSLLPAE